MSYLATTGLTSAEANRLLVSVGQNTIIRKKRHSPVALFFKKLNGPLPLTLITVAILSYFLGERSNAVIILAMVAIGAVLDFVNTYHSEKAVEELEAKVESTIKVRRDGHEVELPTRLIVPGDIIILEAGDLVPADAAVIVANDLFVNESSLTGESFPVEKNAAANPSDQIPEVSNHQTLLMGTSVISGFVTGLVIKTGGQTSFGKLASRLEVAPPESDFERGIRTFSYFVMRLTLVMVVFVFFVNAMLGRGLLESFLFAVAIAVGLTPELLPVILSVSLSRGSVRMAKKDVIVRRLSSIENFGNMNVLCTDKTGTLTEDRIVLVRWIDVNGRQSEKVLRLAALAGKFHTGLAGPFDRAAVSAIKEKLSSVTKIDEIPFDFERRRSSVVIEENSELTLISRGAPEDVLKNVTKVTSNGKAVAMTASFKKMASEQFLTLSKDGYRVLAVASKLVAKKKRFEKSDEAEMVFEGFVAFLDPPKAGVGAALRELENLGIAVKVITGDNEVLATKICREVGLTSLGLITGEQLKVLSDEQLIHRFPSTTIFARIAPEQKERIVLLLKRAGNVVGFLGDGINDAPALKAADVGISVNNAVNVAKDSADIILLQKSLTVLKDGVVEGRKTFQNTLKYILMGLSSNFGNVFSMSGASVVLPFLPMQPSQILLNNFLYDMSQLSLSTDEVDASAITRPLHWDFHLIKRYMVVFGIVSSVFDFLTFFVMIHFFHLTAAKFQTSWFIESLTTQALVIFLIRTRRLPFIESRPSNWLLANVLLMIAIAWLIPFTKLGRLFLFGLVPGSILGAIVVIVLLYLISVEITKRLFDRIAQPNL